MLITAHRPTLAADNLLMVVILTLFRWPSVEVCRVHGNRIPIIIIINKVLIKVTLNKVIAGALYIVICG